MVHHHLAVVFDFSLVSIQISKSQKSICNLELSILGTPSSGTSGHRVREAIRSVVRKPSSSGVGSYDLN